MREWRPALNNGEDHLNGMYCKVRELRFGTTMVVFAFAHGNQFHSE